MEFSRQEYWSGLPFPSPGDLPDPEIELGSPTLQATLYQLSHQGRKMTKLLKNLTESGLHQHSLPVPLSICLSLSVSTFCLCLSCVSCMLLFTPELPSHSWPHRCELRLASLESWERGKEGFFPEGRTGNSWRHGLAWLGHRFLWTNRCSWGYLGDILGIENEIHPASQGSSWAGGVGG